MASWTRRAFLGRHALPTTALVAVTFRRPRSPRALAPVVASRLAAQAAHVDPARLAALAQQAVDAARAAGAQYADARLTRTVGHGYSFGDGTAYLATEAEINGVGIRALVDGYWGFAACPWWTSDAAVQIARDAVAQARDNAQGPPRTVDLGHIPVATGHWTTPIQIDPFTVSVEEKLDTCHDWMDTAIREHVHIPFTKGSLTFIRQERAVATSDGTCVTQTLYTTEGSCTVQPIPIIKNWQQDDFSQKSQLALQGLTPAGLGWELIQHANLGEQLAHARDIMWAQIHTGGKPSVVGRYTVVCDGATMAALLDRTLGVATQLDRALGYEANAGGTSFVDDPLAMVGHLQVAAPLVTVTANRSAPAQLATVAWDDEGVVPEPFTLVKDGLLTDFQTTREQAAWLAPYYAQHGQPVRSHGCAAAEDALVTTLQMPPNLTLEPSPQAIQLTDLVADVSHGILITEGTVRADMQARNGLISGQMREITNGRLGSYLEGGAVSFNTLETWRHLVAVGGAGSEGVYTTEGGDGMLYGSHGSLFDDTHAEKGQPPQLTRHSVHAVAATLHNQPLINLARKA